MTIQRKLIKIETPVKQPGFLGAGHTARPVVHGDFRDTDPFIMLMDDQLVKTDHIPVGGPHPHAGFETVTLVLEGELGDGDTKMKAGDFQLMTAGSGIVHAEIIDQPGRMRILQLWLNLPAKDRHARPRLQDLRLADVPAIDTNGVHIKLYSGSLAGITSPIQHYTPTIIADITLDPGIQTIQQLPADHNTFLYVLNGAVQVGADEAWLQEDQVGWLNISAGDSLSDLVLKSGTAGARFVLYAGKPSGEDIVSHGPFIADSSEDIARLYREYRQGRMKHISTVAG
jgi:redox-sensitive bicupin YhaK (pirin superfamily)